MALQDYARLACFFNGNSLTQVTKIGIKTESGQQRVDLLNEGLAGFTPGSGACTVDVSFAVPIGGCEDEFQEQCVQGAYVTIQIPIGSKSYIGRGKLETVDITQSVNGATEGTFTWLGEMKELS
jgi:hypothetical protein